MTDRDLTPEDAALSAAIRGHASYYAAPPSLTAKLRASQAVTALVPPAPPARAWRALALAASVAFAALLGWNVWTASVPDARAERVGELVVAAHVRALMGDRLTDIASSDQHTVAPWFNGRLDIAPPVVDLTTSGFPLVGGRLDYIERRPAAALVYRHRQHVINLFIWPAEAPAPVAVLSRQGYNIRAWTAGGMQFWAISDLNAADLVAFERLLLAPP